MRSGRFAQTSDAPERTLVTRLGSAMRGQMQSRGEQESGHSPICSRPRFGDSLCEHARLDRPVPGERCQPLEIGAGREELLQVLYHRQELQDGGCRNPFRGRGEDAGSIQLINTDTHDGQVRDERKGIDRGRRDGGV